MICVQLWIQNKIKLLQHNDKRYTDILTFIFGAMCQQGRFLHLDGHHHSLYHDS